MAIDKSRAKIFVAEAEEAVCKSVVFCLTDLGLNVESVENGNVGLRLIEQDPSDLVLFDLRMPETDGYVSKPVNRKILFGVLSDILKRGAR